MYLSRAGARRWTGHRRDRRWWPRPRARAIRRRMTNATSLNYDRWNRRNCCRCQRDPLRLEKHRGERFDRRSIPTLEIFLLGLRHQLEFLRRFEIDQQQCRRKEESQEDHPFQVLSHVHAADPEVREELLTAFVRDKVSQVGSDGQIEARPIGTSSPART